MSGSRLKKKEKKTKNVRNPAWEQVYEEVLEAINEKR